MADGVGLARRRTVLAGWLAVLTTGPAAHAQPAGTAPAPPGARGGVSPEAQRVISELRLARDMLCPRCRDDIERSGVNHPSRRSILGSDKVRTARDMIEAAPGLPGAVPALRLLRHGIEELEYYGEDEATWAIDAAIVALQAEGRVAAGAPPDPRALMGQLRLARRFLCPGCVESDWTRGRRHRAAEELAVAQAMLAASPRLRHGAAVRDMLAAAAEALAAGNDRRADASLAAAIGRLRPLPR